MDGLEENPVSPKEAGFCVCGIIRNAAGVMQSIDDSGVWANRPDNKWLG